MNQLSQKLKLLGKSKLMVLYLTPLLMQHPLTWSLEMQMPTYIVLKFNIYLEEYKQEGSNSTQSLGQRGSNTIVELLRGCA